MLRSLYGRALTVEKEDFRLPLAAATAAAVPESTQLGHPQPQALATTDLERL